MNTKALRQKILDLAIHGKLVPQDPNDDPASVLLERIKAEKERLIKDGKIKRAKRSKAACDKPHYENEVPFEVPSSWEWTTIGDIAESNIGLTYKPTDICDNGIPVYRSNNIQNRRIDKTELVRVDTRILDKQFLAVGDLLICARNGSRRLVGKCALIEELAEPTSFGAFMAVCRSVYNPWISLLLNTNYFDRYLDDSNSATINQVTQTMLLSFQLPFPPKNEQERIIKEVQKWSKLIDDVESGNKRLQALITASKSKIIDLAIHGKLVPQDPTDEPASELLKRINPKAEIACDNAQYGKLPNGWCECNLSSLCKIKGGKRIPRGQTFSKAKTPHIYIRVSDMKNNTIVATDLKYIDDDVYQTIKNYTISSSDLYLTIAGTIGNVGYVPKQFDGMNLTENAAKLTNIICDKKFLMYSLLSSKAQEHFKSRFHQVAQPKLSIETANSTIVCLPPLNEQHRIVAKIEELFALLDNIASAL